MGACGGNEQKELQQQVDSLSTKVMQQDEELSFYYDCMDLLTKGLDSLAVEGNMLLGDNNTTDRASKDAIKERLAGMGTMLQTQRDRVAELEKKLQNSNANAAKMKGMVEYLKAQIAQRDEQISDLQRMVNEKDFDIAMFKSEVNRLAGYNRSLLNTVDEQEESLQQADEALNQAFYIIGTSKELKEKGVLKAGGLFKGNKVNVDNMKTEGFTTIDVRIDTEIPISSKSPSVKSQHPANSYTITTDKATKTSVLKITDTKAFWSLTRYLIIEK
jgi:hypothetical protein